MHSIQMGSATTAPDCLSPSSFFASNPTQTAAVIEGLNPTNHASVKLFVVPVFPPSGRPSDFAAVAVPFCTTS